MGDDAARKDKIAQDRKRFLMNYYALGGYDLDWFDKHVNALLAIDYTEFRTDYVSNLKRQLRAA